jgi:glutaredoxin-related protein
MNKPILYSTGCPKCNVLKKKLAAAGIDYDEETNVEVMESLGISAVPVLKINNQLLSFTEAVKYINNTREED